MPGFENTFTGKDTSINLPNSGEVLKSQENMDNLIIGAAKMQQEAYEKNFNDFKNAVNVPPEFLMSDSAQKTQADMLTAFNDKWGKVYQQYNGNIPNELKLKMQTDKNFLLMNQQKMKSDMEQAMSAKELMQKDIQGNYDHTEIQKRIDDYMQHGTWDPSPPPLSPIDPVEYYNDKNHQLHGTETNVSLTQNINGNSVKKELVAGGTIQQAKDQLWADFHGKDRLANGAIHDYLTNFKVNDPKGYAQNLTDAEKEGTNPIYRWFENNNLERVLGGKDITATKPVPAKSNVGGFNTKQPISATNNRNKDFDVSKEPYSIKYDNAIEGSGSTAQLPNYVKLDNPTDPTKAITLHGIMKVDDNGNVTEEPKGEGETAEFKVIGYSPNSDLIHVQLTRSTSQDTYDKGDELFLKASNYDDILRGKPWNMYRQSFMKQNTTSSPARGAFDNIGIK